jgi:hypothetical protein
MARVARYMCTRCARVAVRSPGRVVDGVHPNDAGLALYAANLAARLPPEPSRGRRGAGRLGYAAGAGLAWVAFIRLSSTARAAPHLRLKRRERALHARDEVGSPVAKRER